MENSRIENKDEQINNINVTNIKELITPNMLHSLCPTNKIIKLFVK